MKKYGSARDAKKKEGAHLLIQQVLRFRGAFVEKTSP